MLSSGAWDQSMRARQDRKTDDADDAYDDLADEFGRKWAAGQDERDRISEPAIGRRIVGLEYRVQIVEAFLVRYAGQVRCHRRQDNGEKHKLNEHEAPPPKSVMLPLCSPLFASRPGRIPPTSCFKPRIHRHETLFCLLLPNRTGQQRDEKTSVRHRRSLLFACSLQHASGG